MSKLMGFTTCNKSDSTFSFDDIVEASHLIREEKSRAIDDMQNLFHKELGADFRRGDIVVFCEIDKKAYNLAIKSIPGFAVNQVKFDRYLDNSVVLNGDYLNNKELL